MAVEPAAEPSVATAVTHSEEPPIRVLARGERWIAISKPSGLAVHPGWAADERYVQSELSALLGRRVWFPHRLDRATSGVLLAALDARAAAALSAAFAERRVEKRYLALVRGLAPETARIDYSLRPGEERGPHVVRVPAVTHTRRLGTFERYSLVEARPETGRLHQIRRHLKHVSLHVIGDTRYGKGEHNRIFRERFALNRLALHAFSLRFPDVDEGAELAPTTVCAAPEGPLAATLAAIGLAEVVRQLVEEAGTATGPLPVAVHRDPVVNDEEPEEPE